MDGYILMLKGDGVNECNILNAGIYPTVDALMNGGGGQ
jgi:hypothetical protein